MPYYVSLTEKARKLRDRETHAERIFWGEIRNKKILGLKFTRQKPILGYIADFYCAELLLIIEIDGEIHEQRKEYDDMRSCDLRACGFQIRRYTNKEIEGDLPYVMKDLVSFIQTLLDSRKHLSQ